MTATDLRREIPRTLFHVLGGLGLAALGLFLPQPGNRVVLGAIFLTALLVDLARLRSEFVGGIVRARLGAYMRPSEQGRLSGAPAFTGGVFLAFLLFPRSVALASLVPLVLGDRAALLVGKGIGRVHLWGKTLEGSLACFAVSFVAYALLAALIPHWFHIPLGALAGAAAVGTLAEALPRPCDDNLAIPLAVGAFLSLFGG